MTEEIEFTEIDLETEGLNSRKIALIQVKSPEFNTGWKNRDLSYSNRGNDILGFLDENFQMRRTIVEEQIEKIIKLMDFAIASGAQILCLPTMVIPKEMGKIFEQKSKNENVIIISGCEYIKDQENLVNVIRLYLPEGFPELDLESTQYKKIYASKYDPKKIKLGQKVNVYKHTGFGNFTILNCFDYSNLNIFFLNKRNLNK